MKRKKLIVSILVGAAVAGAAFYFLGTKGGKKTWQGLKKTGKVTADTFSTFEKEMARNVKQEEKEEMAGALKAFVREALAA